MPVSVKGTFDYLRRGLIGLLGGQVKFDSSAGWITMKGPRGPITVNEAAAMAVELFSSAIDIVCSDFSILPFELYQMNEDGSRNKLSPHDDLVANIIDVRPNKYQSGTVFKYALLETALLNGFGYAHIIRDSMGNPFELHLLNPDYVHPEISDRGILHYNVYEPGKNRNSAKPRKIRALDIIEINPRNGKSILDLASETIKINTELGLFAIRTIKNDSTPQAALTLPERMKSKKEAMALRKQWETVHSGEGRGRIAVLKFGMKLQQIKGGDTLKDVLNPDIKQGLTKSIARLFKIPASRLAEGNSNYSTLSEENRAHVQRTLGFYIALYEDEFNYKLFTPAGTYYRRSQVMLNTDRITQPSKKERFEIYGSAITNGMKNVNECRAEEGLNGIGPDGDVYYRPANLLRQDEKTDPSQLDNRMLGENGRPATDEAQESILRYMISKIIDKETKALTRYEGKENAKSKISAFYQNLENHIKSDLTPFIQQENAFKVAREYVTSAEKQDLSPDQKTETLIRMVRQLS